MSGWVSIDPTLPAIPSDRLDVWIARIVLAAIQRSAEHGDFRMWTRQTAAATRFTESLPLWMRLEAEEAQA